MQCVQENQVPGVQSRNALRTQNDVLSVVLLLLLRVDDSRVEVEGH